PGSTLDVVAGPCAATTAAVRSAAEALAPRMPVRHHPGDPALRSTTDALDPTGYDVVIVLGPDPRPGRGEPDDRTLVTLLNLRAREEESGRHVPVVTEMTDDRNRLIAPRPAGADFVVSGRLIGLLMTQISQNPHLTAVFEELLSPAGNTLHLHPAAHYVTTGRTTSFAAVAASAARRGECAIGYRSATASGPGMRINPPNARVRYWHAQDQIVLIAPGD
ncbi:NAD-binding lipoprotein, partial [Streptomyces sp. NPDC056295]